MRRDECNDRTRIAGSDGGYAVGAGFASQNVTGPPATVSRTAERPCRIGAADFGFPRTQWRGPAEYALPVYGRFAYRLALLARRVDRITALAEELGSDVIAIEADVTDRDSLVAAAERVQDELGGADVLINNAGVMLLGPFSSQQRAEFRQMIEVNLLGAITASEVFLEGAHAFTACAPCVQACP